MRLFGLPRHVQQVNPHKDDQEPAKQRYRIGAIGRIEPLEQDRRRDDRARREKHKVDRVDDVGAKRIQCLVEVIHLNHDAKDDDDAKDVGARVGELVVARERQFQCDPKRLDGHDRDRTNKRTNGQVDDRVFGAMFRCDLVDHVG